MILLPQLDAAVETGEPDGTMHHANMRNKPSNISLIFKSPSCQLGRWPLFQHYSRKGREKYYTPRLFLQI